MPLSAKRQRFVDEYLIDLNGTQAAIRAGYSAKTANEQAARLLANVSVKQAVEEGIKARAAQSQVTQEYVVKKLHKLAELSSDPNTDTYNPQAANKSLELLGKHLGMFSDKVEAQIDGRIEYTWRS